MIEPLWSHAQEALTAMEGLLLYALPAALAVIFWPVRDPRRKQSSHHKQGR